MHLILTATPALAPIFPYIDIGPMNWGGFTIHPFGILVGIAIFTGMYFVQKRGDQLGLNPALVAELVTVTVVAIFVGSHLFMVLAYQPERVLEDPLVLVRLWDGIASFGGLIGLVLTAWYYHLRGKLPFWTSMDVLIWGGLHAWVFGRAGCSVAHDHPGLFTDSWFSVRWPVNHPDQILNVHGLPGRHDLGLYEFLYTFVLLGIFYFSHKRWSWRPGFSTGLLFVFYAPARFGMDFLRAVDKRYFHLTPAQYGSLLMFAFGLYLLRRHFMQKPEAGTPTEPVEDDIPT